MIGSQHDHRLPPTTLRPMVDWWRIGIVIAVTLAVIFGGLRLAHSASLRVCFTDPANQDVATAPVFLNANPFNPDALAGSTLAGTTRCSLLPIPATLAKGVNFDTTMKYVNGVGEVSAPSNVLPFRNPGAPPVPVLLQIQIVAP